MSPRICLPRCDSETAPCVAELGICDGCTSARILFSLIPRNPSPPPPPNPLDGSFFDTPMGAAPEVQETVYRYSVLGRQGVPAELKGAFLVSLAFRPSSPGETPGCIAVSFC